MAEENVLDDNLDDMEGVTEDLGFDEDQDSLGSQDNQAKKGIQNKIKSAVLNGIQAMKKNRRYQIVAGVVVLVLVVMGAYLGIRKPEAKPPVQKGMTQQEAPTFDSSEIVKKKPVKKKKKKIKYIEFYKQLESKELSPILRELSYNNVAYNLVQNGKQYDLEVDEDQLEQAKQLLAIKGLPSGTVKGYEIFDEASNLGVTEFDKRIRLIRALSGEMERSIMEFDVVDYAYVEIVIPETRLFAVTQPPVTSSILIKRRNGANINDETVYAIIQLVSNSVENLLPENISVVDTEGRVLSTGVLDRIKKKQKVEEKKMATVTTMGNGKVIIPAIEDVVDWFQLKFNYETVLEKKAVNQLSGVLPEGSYKVAVTIDLNSVTQTGAPDIKQIITSVVVDDQFEEVTLDDVAISQITQAVAGAVGYIEGRDRIHISKAAFLPKRIDLIADLPVDESTVAAIILPEDTVLDQIKRWVRLWPIFGIGALFTTILWLIFLSVKKLIHSIGNGFRATQEAIANAKDKKVSQEDVPSVEDQSMVASDDSEVSEAVGLNDVVNKLKAKADFAKVIQLKAMSTQEIEIVAKKIKEMIKD